jgi:hypothetical protein
MRIVLTRNRNVSVPPAAAAGGNRLGGATRGFAYVALAITVLTAGSGPGLSASLQRRDREDAAKCPTHLLSNRTSLSIDSALHAATRLIPRAYTPGQTGKPPRIIILQLLSLQPQVPALPGSSFWHRVAAKRCGPAVASASWVAAVAFPDTKIAVPSTGISFLTLTANGWTLWYRYR